MNIRHDLIFVPLTPYSGYYEIPAQIVDVAPHLASVATFVVHRYFFYENRFVVSNLETGSYVGNPEKSAGHAVEKAKKLLLSATVYSLELAYKKILPEVMRLNLLRKARK